MTRTTDTVRPLNRAEVAFLRGEFARSLAFAERKAAETDGTDEWLVWTGQVNAGRDTLRYMDSLCAAEPWYEPESVAATT